MSAHVIERTFSAPIALVWELWTTPDGMGSWYGPPGFRADVSEMEVVVGGAFAYTMSATSPEMVARMEGMGRPASWSVAGRYTVVSPQEALAWEASMGPATLVTSATFAQTDQGVTVTVTLTSSKPGMADGAAMGWKATLEKLAQRLAS